MMKIKPDEYPVEFKSFQMIVSTLSTASLSLSLSLSLSHTHTHTHTQQLVSFRSVMIWHPDEGCVDYRTNKLIRLHNLIHCPK